jgi:polar amino acid transport system permease protein
VSFLQDWSDAAPNFLDGLIVSVEVTLASLAVGLPLALAFAVASMSKTAFVRIPVLVVVEVGRGMPALLVLSLAYFGLPQYGITWSSFFATVVALGFTTSAYAAEYIRGGLQSVPQGEVEAAAALNFSRLDTMRYVVIPEGLRVSIPPVLGLSIQIFQASSLAFTIALPELMSKVSSEASASLKYISLFLFAAALYASITIPASYLTLLLERRLSRHLAWAP